MYSLLINSQALLDPLEPFRMQECIMRMDRHTHYKITYIQHCLSQGYYQRKYWLKILLRNANPECCTDDILEVKFGHRVYCSIDGPRDQLIKCGQVREDWGLGSIVL